MNVTNPKRSSRLAAKEQRESAEPKDVEVDSRKRGRDKSDNFSSIYKRATPASTKKATQVAVVNEAEVHSPGPAIPIRAREKLTAASSPPVAHLAGASSDQRSNTPALISDGANLHRINSGNGVNCAVSELEKDVVHSPAQRAPNNPLVSKLKESQKVKGSLSHVKLSPKPSPATVHEHNLGAKNARLQTNKPPSTSLAATGQHSRIGQQDSRFSAVRPEALSSGPEVKLLNDRAAPPAAPKPVRERHGGRPAADHGAAGALGGADNDDLRRRLGGAVERWISARSALPGGEGEDLCGFRPEIERLVKLIAFEAFEIKQELDEVEDGGGCGADGVGRDAAAAAGGGGDTYGREVTTTRFRLEHPEVKAPFVFESTQHVFSGSVLGAAAAAAAAGGGVGRQRHRLEGLKWKVEFELIGFFVLALHTQTFEVDEDVELPRLEKVREALQTHITSSELGVLFMLAGSASLGPAAWQFVEDVCFWTANFSLPEFPGPC